MNWRAALRDENLLWEALLISLGAHLLLFVSGHLAVPFEKKHVVEIDITNMGHLGAPAGQRKTAPAPPKPKAAPRREWTKPAPNEKVAPAPVPTKPAAPVEEPSPVTAPAETPPPSEYDIGTGQGMPGVLSRLPQLLNLSDLGRILEHFYPEEARAAGKEAAVTLDLHIDTDGHVQAADIVRSGGPAFDAAAIQVAKLLRFTPAFVGSQRVAVKLRQTIQFKMEGQ